MFAVLVLEYGQYWLVLRINQADCEEVRLPITDSEYDDLRALGIPESAWAI